MWAASILGEPVSERAPKRRVAILISGRGSNMSALIAAAQAPHYPAEIALVVSNRPDAQGIAAAQAAGIATAIVDHAPFGKDREAFEAALERELQARRIDIVCLAGFMRLLTPAFVSRWPGRMLNVHPALLPSFKGLDTHARALAAGVKIHGATVHFVTLEMDSGPIVAQGAIAVRVLAIEHEIYPRALRLVAEGRVRPEDGRCRLAGADAPGTKLVVPSAGT
jgi:phosphoribosylglycinamide formyltransferase-1